MSYNPCGNDWWCLLSGGEGTGRNAGGTPIVRSNKPVTSTKKVTRTPPPADTKKPTWQSQSHTSGSGGKPNTYQGLKNMGYGITKTNPKTGVTIFDSKASNGCQWLDIACHFKGLKIPENMILPIAAVGGLLLILLLIKR